jgi:rubredoxin
MKYICELCGFIYDEEKGLPQKGIAPGTPFAALDEDFECPACYSEKQAFDRVSTPESRPLDPVLACTEAKQVSDK